MEEKLKNIPQMQILLFYLERKNFLLLLNLFDGFDAAMSKTSLRRKKLQNKRFFRKSSQAHSSVTALYSSIKTWNQFHQHFTNSFYTHRSQNRKKTAKFSVHFCAFWTFKCKSFGNRNQSYETF